MNKPRSFLLQACLGLVALAVSPAVTMAQSAYQGVDMGDASVMSQQGQRLKIAVPYGSDVGQPFPVLRFEVQSVEVPAGYRAPDARHFTISKPESRNLIFIQSAETVTAPNLKLVLAVAGTPGKRIEYDINVPPATATTAMAATAAPPAIKQKMRKAKKHSNHNKVRATMKRAPAIGKS